MVTSIVITFWVAKSTKFKIFDHSVERVHNVMSDYYPALKMTRPLPCGVGLRQKKRFSHCVTSYNTDRRKKRKKCKKTLKKKDVRYIHRVL